MNSSKSESVQLWSKIHFVTIFKTLRVFHFRQVSNVLTRSYENVAILTLPIQNENELLIRVIADSVMNLRVKVVTGKYFSLIVDCSLCVHTCYACMAADLLSTACVGVPYFQAQIDLVCYC